MNVRKNIKLLRKTNIDISGCYYSEKYAEEHNLADKYMSRCFGENPSVWIPEQVEVTLKGEEVLCRIRKIGNWYEKQKNKFIHHLEHSSPITEASLADGLLYQTEKNCTEILFRCLS